MKAIKSKPSISSTQTMMGVLHMCPKCKKESYELRSWKLKDGRSFRQYIHEKRLQDSSSEYQIFKIIRSCTEKVAAKS